MIFNIMDACDQKHFKYTLTSGNPDKLRMFKDNSLPPEDLLDIETFSRILSLDSMKELLQSREVVFDNTIQNCCEIINNKIHINPRYSLTDCLKLTITKLRKYQLQSRYDMHSLFVNQMIVYYRALEADSAVYLCRVLWETKLSNIDRDLYDTVRDLNPSLRPCFKTYEQLASSKWSTVYTGEAFFEAFVSWFVNYPLKHVDTSVVRMMLSDYNKINHSDNCTLLFMNKVFTINNKTYLSPEFISSTDPLFVEVRDKANANFMWFIKFERSITSALPEQYYDSEKPPKEESLPECVIIDFNEFKNKRSK